MSVMGNLPADNSQQFRLSGLDFQKLLRALVVALISLFVTVSPIILGASYVIHWHGRSIDCTAGVLAVVSVLVEMARRFLAGGTNAPQQK
jgi:ABC-type sulfate transport system permease subunit